ncbi:sugar porter family MFS transporter [Pseudonocardia acaciae]|uniref:sugar porter family MFS transporter n=1 Tax=Pseudonocardia acaciae TaxID=551276 RepID=UPI0007E8E1CA|nr:sugar porter family MFS transporter [Pseudonocardia acaciae]
MAFTGISSLFDSARGIPGPARRVVYGAATVAFVYGYDQGSIGGAELYLESQLGLSPLTKSIVVTAVPVGTLFGALAGGKIANAIGRKPSMMAIAVGFLVLSALQGAAVDAWSLTAIRLVLGLVVGVSIVAAPQFIAESVTATIRGSALVTFQVATVVGLTVSYIVAVALSATESWRLVLSIGALPGLLAIALLYNLPDTPRWYLMKGRRDEALHTLRNAEPDKDPNEQVAAIEQDLRAVESGRFRQLFRPPLRKAGVFVVGLGLLVQLTGINAIVYYSPSIMRDVGFKTTSGALLGAAMLQVIGLVAVIVAFLVVDRWGRRPVLMTGIGVMLAANVVMVIAFASGTAQVLGFIGVALFLIGFQFGWGALVWVYAAESMPAQMRAVGGSVLMAADLFGNIVIGLFFPNAMASMGGVWVFALFFVLSAIAITFVYRLAPETRYRPLEDIRTYWEQGGRW